MIRNPFFVVLLCGCAVSVQGEIDGDVPVFTDALYGQANIGSYGVFVVSLTSDGLDCEEREELKEDFEDVASDGGDPDAFEDLYRAAYPEEYWRALLVGATDSFDDALVEEFDIEPEGRNSITIFRFTDFLDSDYYAQIRPFSDYADTYEADLGEEFNLVRSEDEGVIEGSFEADFDDRDDDDAGRIRVSFRAAHCSDLDNNAGWEL
jgi:hypothetical protein